MFQIRPISTPHGHNPTPDPWFPGATSHWSASSDRRRRQLLRQALAGSLDLAVIPMTLESTRGTSQGRQANCWSRRAVDGHRDIAGCAPPTTAGVCSWSRPGVPPILRRPRLLPRSADRLHRVVGPRRLAHCSAALRHVDHGTMRLSPEENQADVDGRAPRRLNISSTSGHGVQGRGPGGRRRRGSLDGVASGRGPGGDVRRPLGETDPYVSAGVGHPRAADRP